MHHALEIQEILLNIFDHCRFPSGAASDLPALVITCRAFKEPALDILWENLVDPSPLARCLPGASYHSPSFMGAGKRYSFGRSLTQVEWSVLRSYTRRIRLILDMWDGFDWQSVGTFLDPPATEPLFPNLRHLRVARSAEIKIKHLLYMPFPSLISFAVLSGEVDQDVLQASLESIFKFSPNFMRLNISVPRPNVTFINFFSSYICRWRNLHTLDCAGIPLDVGVLAHLSRMPALTQLTCTPSATFPFTDSPVFFLNLHRLISSSEFLDPISLLLIRIRLPVITFLVAGVKSRPSKPDFSSFLASVQTSVIGHTMQRLRFLDGSGMQNAEGTENPRPVLVFEDLQPCMAFSNLRRLDLDITWGVDLTDNELLALASAWPHLENLFINEMQGWRTAGGITPNGLLQLLQTCRSLSGIALAIDTRGYTEFRESPTSLGLTLPPKFFIHVIDSPIEEEYVPAIAAFLAVIATRSDMSFCAGVQEPSGRSDRTQRWYDAYKRAKEFSVVSGYPPLIAKLGYTDQVKLN